MYGTFVHALARAKSLDTMLFFGGGRSSNGGRTDARCLGEIDNIPRRGEHFVEENHTDYCCCRRQTRERVGDDCT